MNNFPFFGFGYPRPYYTYYQNHSNFIEEEENKEEVKINEASDTEDKKSDTEAPILEILGIKLYLDDIIILCLLFFLYKEGVQDEFLFIALILLLLS